MDRPSFQYPLKIKKISRGFYFGKRPYHLGVDFVADQGTPIYSSHSGRVVYAGKRLTGYGNTVVVEHPSGWASLYAHLHAIKTSEGKRVKKGELIGLVGQTGKATGAHLHFEIMYKETAVNPIFYLKED